MGVDVNADASPVSADPPQRFVAVMGASDLVAIARRMGNEARRGIVVIGF